MLTGGNLKGISFILIFSMSSNTSSQYKDEDTRHTHVFASQDRHNMNMISQCLHINSCVPAGD